jgi:NAD(P)-dependent dehydrogenase (short-subunit alcohol dehydrogenase family)
MDILERFRLDNKTAIVTGGSGLYGRQMVFALAQAGATVYTASRNLDNNIKYAETLQKTGLKVFAEQVDQSDEQSVKDLVERIKQKERKIDILINNSVLRIMKGFNDDIASFDMSMKVNATGLFIITRHIGNLMAENGNGSIINIGSYMGSLGPDDTLYKDMDFSGFSSPDYFFHKGGMTNFTRFIASYYGQKNVRCNVIELGGFFNNQNPVFVERYSQRTFLKRMANDTDIMGIIVFLASDASSYITGAAIPVDGGYSAK